MSKTTYWAMPAAMVAGWLALMSSAQAAPPMAATNVKQQKACGLNSPCPVTPNTFGYYETRWRQWPGQARPDQTFPQSLGRERLPTPPGEPTPELPRAQQRLPGETPLPPSEPFEGGILPPGGIRIPGGAIPSPGIPGMPGEPGLPQPPGGPSGLPGLPPLNTPGPGPLPPGLPLDPQGRAAQPSGAANDPTAQNRAMPTPAGMQPGQHLPAAEAAIAVPETASRGPVPAVASPPAVGSLPTAEAAPKTAPAHPIVGTMGQSLQAETFPSKRLPFAGANTVGGPTAADASPASSAALAETPQPFAPLAGSAELPKPLAAEQNAPAVESGMSLAPQEQLSTLWRLKRAIDGLKTAPAPQSAEQSGFAEVTHDSIEYKPNALAATDDPAGEADKHSVANARMSLGGIRAVDHQLLDHDPLESALAAEDRRSPIAGLGEQPADETPSVEPAVTGRGAVALEGFCPVSLVKNEQWVQGQAEWSVNHLGRTYHCAGPVERECFLVNPDRYVPALGGSDPVVLLETARRVPGQLDYCVTYDGKLYMFCNAANLAKFRQDARRYINAH